MHSSKTARTLARLAKQFGAFVLVVLVFGFQKSAGAQVDQGTITGVVQDESGAVIPAAQLTITNIDTNLVLNGTADSGGNYVFSPLKIGRYKISATAPGFSTTSQENLQLNIQARLNIVLTLKPGGTMTEIVVSTAPPLLQTEQASVGQVLSTQTINNTPLNGRNWVYIAQLTAGVAPSVSGQSRGGGSGDFFANGQRATQNDFVLDGVDNNVNVIDFMNGATYSVRPPPDALAEFKVETSNFSAEFGHSAGAVLNASIKSGTNDVHGAAWEYLRNTSLDAKDWNALSIPKYIQNQFGATLGFPLLKNKLFYFGDIEANRIVFGAASVLTVPTTLMRQGNFTELLNPSLTGSAQAIQLFQPNSGGTRTLQCNGQNNTFCVGQISPVAQNILNLYPLPNTNGGKLTNNYVGNVNSSSNTIQWDQRVDWNISPKDQTFARYSYLHVQSHNPPALGTVIGGNSIGGNFTYATGLSENMMASETHSFSSRLTNEARFGYNWGAFLNLQQNFNQNIAASLGLGGVPTGPDFPFNGGLPGGVITGLTTFGTSATAPSVENQNVYQILDNLSYLVGRHSLKFGLSLQSVRMAFLQPPASRGLYNYTGLYTSNLGKSFTGYGVADFLANQMNSAQLSNESTVNDTRWYRAGYFEDDWKATQKLTMNIGVRYEYYEPNKEQAGRQANFVVNQPSGGIGTGTGVYLLPEQSRNVTLPPAFLNLLAANKVALQYTANERLVSAQKLNFAPRLGWRMPLIRGQYFAVGTVSSMAVWRVLGV